MALTSALCSTFKKELLEGDHDFNNGADAFKIALFKANASITGTHGAATTNYSDMTGASDELAATGNYSSGGNTLTNVYPSVSGTKAITDFAATSWTSATFTTRGALIYNSNDSNSAVMVIDFGGDYTVTGGTFTIAFPTADASNAIIRIA